MIDYWWLETDNVIVLPGVKDPVDETYVDDATITGQLQDADGNNVGSVINFSYLSGTDGEYYGIIPDDVGLSDGETYTLVLTLERGTFKTTMRIVRRAAYKGPDRRAI